MHTRTGLVVFCAAVQFLSAQIADLATTDDGSIVYFSTMMRPVGTASGFTPKILSWQVGGRTQVFRERLNSGGGVTNPFQLSIPSVSGDGSVVAYTGAQRCESPYCGRSWAIGSWERYQGDVVSSSGQVLATGAGVAGVSRNGRYAIFHSRGAPSSLPDSFDGLLTRVDLITGDRVEGIPGFRINLPFVPVPITQVASNGVVVAMARNWRQLVLFDGTTVRTLKLARAAFRFAMDDQARVLYFETGTGAGAEIAVYDVASDLEQALVSCPEGAWQPSLSRDGRRLLFLSRANFAGRNDQGRLQAFLIRTDGSELRQLTRPEDDVTSAVLAGDGMVAYASTGKDQLLRIDVADGRVEEVIPVTPALTDELVYSAPGSEVELSGSNLTTSDLLADRSPHPGVLGGVSILLNGEPVPVAWVTPNRIAVQVPWETALDKAELALETPAKSVLERGTVLDVRRNWLKFLRGTGCEGPITDGYRYLVYALHEDYRATVTDCSPAWNGEVIHVYMTGLGPAEPAVPTGVTAPAEPPSIPVEFPRTCELSSSSFSGDVGVVSAVLAPDTVGVYRVDIRLPDTLGVSNSWSLRCGTQPSEASGYLLIRPKP